MRPLLEVAGVFFKLGLSSFGGPVAHLGYFHAECVRRRGWLTDEAYADLVALCQFLPGPASSQIAFALGMHRAGIGGAIAASLCFLLPSAAIMIAFAYGVAAISGIENSGWIHGLQVGAVAVVGQAVVQMWRKLCRTSATSVMAVVSAAIVLVLSGPWVQVAVIGAGGVAGWVFFGKSRRGEGGPGPGTAAPVSMSGSSRWVRAAPMAALMVFGVLLVGLPVVARATASRDIAVFDSFYRSGSLVFGGGHVVLPLLREELVPRGWMGDDVFLAGYGAAQAVPGPRFSFAAFLGTIMYGGSFGWLGGLWCLAAIFLPAWLLIGGALPYWHGLRSKKWADGGMRGANAAVVGVLLAALYSPVGIEGIRGVKDLVAALGAFVLLQSTRVPPVAVVALCAAAGQWLL